MLERRRSYLRRALTSGVLLAPLGVLPLGLVEACWILAEGTGLHSPALAMQAASSALFLPAGAFVVLGLLAAPVMLAFSLLAERLAQQRLAEPVWLGRIYAVASVPLIAWFVSQGLAGRRAQQLPARPLVALVLGGLALAGTYLGVRLVVGARERFRVRRWGRRQAIVLALSLGCAASLFYAADQRVLAGLYPALHYLLALVAVVLAQLAVAALYAAWRPNTRRLGQIMHPRVAFGVALLLISAGSISLRAASRSEVLRFVVFERSVLQRKLFLIAETLELVPQRAAAPRPAATAAPSATEAERRPGPRFPDANVVLISIDALRADHVGAYGYRRAITPAIDRLAATGSTFARAYCPVPTTSFSLTALLTGSRVDRAGRRALLTLPAVLRRYGYKTGGFFPPSIFYIDGERFKRFEKTTFDFEYAKYEHLDAAGRVDQALEFLDAYRERRFFVWLHFFEPHEPYELQPGFDLGDRAVDRYDSEIAYVDKHLGRLLERIRRDFPNTVIALTADHGEAFGEHGMHYHGSSLYDEQTRVPLIIDVPAAQQARVDGPAQSIDLAPTLLGLLDIPVPAQMEGTDLGPWLAGEAPEKLPGAFIQYQHKKAVVDGKYKLIHDTARGFSELYDLGRDPGEQVNLVARRPQLTANLLAQLARWEHPTRGRAPVDRDFAVRRLLDRARQGDTGTIPRLVELFRASDAPLRREVIDLLVRLRARAALDLLVEAASSADPGQAIPATIGAALLGHRQSLRGLRPLLARADLPAHLRRDALLARALHAGDKSTVGELCQILDASHDVYERIEIIEALGKLGDASATGSLRRQLRSLRTRLPAIDALASSGGPAAFPDLVRALRRDRFISWREHAAYALGRSGERRAVPHLKHALREDPEPAVVEAALWSLTRLGASIPARSIAETPAWTCGTAGCKLALGHACTSGQELLLLTAPPRSDVEVFCGDVRVGVLEKEPPGAPLDEGRLSLPALVAPLDGGQGLPLRLASQHEVAVQFVGVRPQVRKRQTSPPEQVDQP